MMTQNQFDCFLIGEGTITTECAKFLLQRGHQILGIISPDESISDWAQKKGISHIPPTDNLLAFLSQQPFDYLFSIVNKSVLPKEILELPRHCSINYHNALLPRYAGYNATSWALMHLQKTHGITWHRMSNIVDGGDILKKVFLDISEGETAFTLNGKCYEAAIYSFAQLIDELSLGTTVATPQNLNDRTYFSPAKRPSAGGLLNFNRSAYELDGLVRALDFGPYPNPLGLAKLAIECDFIVVSRIEVLDEISQRSPGTITGIEPDFLKVSTSNYEVALRQLKTLEGEALSIPDFVKNFTLEIGYRFKEIEAEQALRIEKFNTLIAKHEAFWKERLARLQPITIPFLDQRVSHLKQKQIKSVRMPVPDEVIFFLRECHPDWNLGDFLLAAFVGYLARIGGRDNFDIGFRDIELAREIDGNTSIFAPNVPCHLEINLKQNFEEFFEAIREQVELTKQHKTYARDAVVRYPELRKVPELKSAQIFPVVIERVEKIDDQQAQLVNELTFIIPEDAKECCWLYNSEALDDDTNARLLEQFSIFLQSIITDSTQSIAYLPLLSEPDLHQILVEWNDTDTDYPQDKYIHQLFEEQVKRTPDHVAVVFESQQLSYRELNERANQLAHYLQELGVGPEVLVGICVERSLDMVVGLLGILKGGGAYVPLGRSDPQERLAFILEDTQVPVLLTQKSLVEKLPSNKAHIICLDTDWEKINRLSKKTPNCQTRADNLAYVIYTSGSTGKPKGVAIPHQSVTRLLFNTNYIQLEPDDKIAQVSNNSFDAATFEIWGALLHGGKLVIISKEILLSPQDFAQQIREQEISVLFLTTALFNQLVSTVPQAFKNLRYLLFGGEAVDPRWVKKILKKAPPQRLLHVYGPTENTTFSSWYLVQDVPEGAKTLPIGRSISNTQIYILDPHLNPSPIAVPGELYIGGVGLARGYLNRPELTAEKFIANPFGLGRLYKTGDLARYLPDGNIEFLGRIDNQVKIRGFRIELGEIETILSTHPQVQQSVVIAREDHPRDKRLVAYVVSEDAELTPRNLRDFLKTQLPEYMLPSAFVQLETLPLTPNGKVDRKGLPNPDANLADVTDVVVPKTKSQELIANLFSTVLKIHPVGLHQSFFDLGGQSLLANQLISRLRQTFELDIPLRTVFEAPTVAELSSRIETIIWAMQKFPSPSNDTTDNYEEGRL